VRVLKRTACPRCRENGKDRSGNNLVTYEDGHSYCFACGYTVGMKTTKVNFDLSETVTCPGIEHRGINQATLQSARVLEYAYFSKTGKVLVDKEGRPQTDGIVLFPFYDSYNKLIGIKYRNFVDEIKRGSKDGAIWVEGELTLGGLHTLKGKKELCIWEGEIDWLTALQIDKNRDHLFIPGTKTVKYIKQYSTLLRKYKRIYIGFDNDDAGQLAREEVLEILPIHLLYFIEYGRYNDLNEAWLEEPGIYESLINTAYQESSDSIITGQALVEGFVQYFINVSTIDYISTGLDSVDQMLGGGLTPGEVMLLAAETGMGKALDIQTPVWTTKGWKFHGDLVPGDYVYHPSGTPTEVVAVTQHFHNRPTVRMSFNKGEDILCDENHLWEVSYLDRNFTRHTVVMSAGELAKTNGKYVVTGSHRGYRLPKVEPILCEDVTLPIPLPRKLARISVPQNEGYFYIRSAVRTQKYAVTNCIQVASPDGLYCAGLSMVPTHNSTLCASIAYDIMKERVPVFWAGTEMQYGAVLRKFIEMDNGRILRKKPGLSKWTIEHDDIIKTVSALSENTVFYKSMMFEWEKLEEALLAAIFQHDTRVVVLDVLTDMLPGEWQKNEQVMQRLSWIAAGDIEDNRPPVSIIGVVHTKTVQGLSSSKVTIPRIVGGKCVTQKATAIVAMEGSMDRTERKLKVLKQSRMNSSDTFTATINFNSTTRRYEDAQEQPREDNRPTDEDFRLQLRTHRRNRQ